MIMNTHRKQLKKLGHGIDEFEKKLSKIIKESDDGTGLPCQKERRNNAASQGISEKNTSSIINSSKPKVKKQSNSKNQQLASVEVSVKTKCPERSKKRSTKGSTIVTLPLSHKKSETVPHRNQEHCYCTSSSKSTKNLVWSNILRHPPTSAPQFMVVESKELEVTKTEPTINHKTGSSNRRNATEELLSYHNYPKIPTSKTSPTSSEENSAEIVSPGASCEVFIDSQVFRHKINNCKFGAEFFSDAKPKACKTFNNGELLDSKNRLLVKPMETLHFLMEELHKKVEAEDESTRKLVSEMKLTLDKMAKDTMSASEASYRSKFSSRKLSSRGTCDVDNAPKSNAETLSKVNKHPERQSYKNIAEQVLLGQPGNREVIANNYLSDSVGKLKGNCSELNRNDHPEIKKRKNFTGNKFEDPTKLKDDKVTQINLSVDRDEKVKAEIELLKKQLNLQLRSVDIVTAKESEYHSLLTNLVGKVQKLEDQLNDQTKAAQNFFAQSNALLEQNNLIPALQASHDLLSKRLQDALYNYEKLKADYSLLKLEKDKYCALYDVKDKEIKRFKEEIINVQLLVEEQVENLKNFEKFESTSDKVDAIINLIDSQSNIIKSKLGSVKLGDEASVSPVSSASFHSTSSCRSTSPDLATRKPTSKNKPGVTAGLPGNNSKGFPTVHYLLNVPELQSPKSS